MIASRNFRQQFSSLARRITSGQTSSRMQKCLFSKERRNGSGWVFVRRCSCPYPLLRKIRHDYSHLLAGASKNIAVSKLASLLIRLSYARTKRAAGRQWRKLLTWSLCTMPNTQVVKTGLRILALNVQTRVASWQPIGAMFRSQGV